ncbi:hypothetical protein PLESTB_001756200 [Pleodorina starrii]|uniref:Uncharacterized protein n=1 Tax=Pleodorina starrii TaxID=330485 RepID=A0A9W6C0Z9_9CHLO|nr:hypothetical protein PLESTM_000597900 [Pleodorina starrii]GLC61435.1 hypothetical protein PLESTB_001756200 [Pleodorina starrii]GLC74079.1 hypothetical protein PLESTF_001457600 [Pleodorina starrii]
MEPDVPYVPHMFVQRIDALPEEVLESVLATLAPQTEDRPGFWQSLGWGKNANSGAVNQQLSKAELRSLLQRHRREELAADADTADYSSEPYDSIPRQVQLQWRVYARLYPEEVAESEKLASMLQQSGQGAAPPGTGQGRWPGNGGGGSGGLSTLFGFLPSVTALQQTVRGLVPAAQTPAAAALPRDAAGPAPAAPALAAPAAGTRLGAGAPATARTTELRRRPDPLVQKLSRSLEQWYELHREQTRPLRRGRRARLLVVRGVDLPAEWRDSMRLAAAPAAGAATAGDSAGGRLGLWQLCGGGLLRAWAAAGGAAAGAVGLRRRPRVWEVGGTAAGLDGCGRTQRAQRLQEQQRQGEGSGSQALRPRREANLADGGRGGLVAAQAAAREMSFVLRRTMLIPPEWL